MHSMVIMQFKKFVVKGFGYSEWMTIKEQANFREHESGLDKAYADEDFFHLFSTAIEILEVPKETALEKFGIAITPFLLQFYDPPSGMDLYDFLEIVESEIHKMVRHGTKYADPAQLVIKRTGATSIEIFYDSQRNIPWFGLGIIKGLIDHFQNYRTTVDLTHLGGKDYVFKVNG